MKRIGVIGYGVRMRHVVQNVVRQSEGAVSVVAFHDISEKAVQRARAEHPGIRCCSSVKELVGTPEVDWVTTMS